MNHDIFQSTDQGTGQLNFYLKKDLAPSLKIRKNVIVQPQSHEDTKIISNRSRVLGSEVLRSPQI